MPPSAVLSMRVRADWLTIRPSDLRSDVGRGRLRGVVGPAPGRHRGILQFRRTGDRPAACRRSGSPRGRVWATDLLQLLEERKLDRIISKADRACWPDLARAGLVDGLDLAVSPLMVGGGQITLGDPRPDPARYRFVQAIAGKAFTRYLRRFTRYLRADATPLPSQESA